MSALAISPLVAQIREYRSRIYEQGYAEGRNGRRTSLWPVAVQQPAGEFLRDLVIREGAKTTFETGLGLGLSTLFIVEGLLTRNPAGNISHTAVEPHPEGFDFAGERIVIESGAVALTTIITADSTVALPQLLARNHRFDFAYIDGGHLFEFAFIDIFNALRLVRAGGLIVVDDHWMASVQTALGFFHANRSLQFELYDPAGPGKRFVGLRVPNELDSRHWDHFVEFSRATLPEYPWRQ